MVLFPHSSSPQSPKRLDLQTEPAMNNSRRPSNTAAKSKTRENGSSSTPMTAPRALSKPPSTTSKDDAATNDKSPPDSNSTKLSLPLIPLSAGLQQKESALALASWVTLALTLDGRDKLTKLLQYASRLLAYLLSSTAPHHAQRMAALKVSLTNSRKAFRLGRTLIELQRLKSLRVGQALKQAVLPQKQSITNTPSSPWTMTLGSALKLLGLAGFWAADNVNFLAMAGVWDNYTLSNDDRRKRRERLQSQSAIWANRSYFVGSVAGLYVTLRAYCEHWRQQQAALENDDSTSPQQLEQIKAKHFGLFTLLLKSVCDVLVFSNNPGLDFWQHYRGRKLHEGLHCLCGLTSAATVLYNNFPNAKR